MVSGTVASLSSVFIWLDLLAVKSSSFKVQVDIIFVQPLLKLKRRSRICVVGYIVVTKEL